MQMLHYTMRTAIRDLSVALRCRNMPSRQSVTEKNYIMPSFCRPFKAPSTLLVSLGVYYAVTF